MSFNATTNVDIYIIIILPKRRFLLKGIKTNNRQKTGTESSRRLETLT